MDGYVSNPANMVETTFSTPQLEPGDSGTLEFTMMNRYVNTLENITVEFEVYRAANEDSSKDVTRVKYPPTLTGIGHTGIGDGTVKVAYSPADLQPRENVSIKIKVDTKDDTFQATYLVRTQLTFDYTNGTGPRTTYNFKSRGHFTDAEWKTAEDGTSFLYTNLDIGSLNVSGIFPDTTFGVRNNFPQWPKWLIFLPGAVIFAGLGAFFLAVENYGMFPGVKKWMDSLGKKKD